MKVVVDESDFESVMGPGWVASVCGEHPTLLGGTSESKERRVLSAVLKIVKDVILSMVPIGMRAEEVELKIGIEGSPFGVGINGEATVKLRILDDGNMSPGGESRGRASNSGW